MVKTGKILFTAAAGLIAVLSGVMLVSSFMLIGKPELAGAPERLAEWGASAYIAFWGLLFAGAVLSLLGMHLFTDTAFFHLVTYYFLLPVPIIFSVVNTFFYHDWMRPVYDSFRSWSRIHIGGSVWLIPVVLLIFHQLWMLGGNLKREYDPMVMIARTVFNLLILLVFIPVTGFFGWTAQPPLLSSTAFFVLNVFIYIQYLWQRSKWSGNSVLGLSVFNAVFGVIVLILYAYLNSDAFSWLHHQLTMNPIFYVLVLALYGGIGYLGSAYYSNRHGGTTTIHFYRPIEGKEILQMTVCVIIIIPLLFAGTGLSATHFFNNIISSASDPAATVEKNTMNRLRTQDRTKFLRGDKLDSDTIAANTSALDEFISGGVSYRMEGTFLYGIGPLSDIYSFETTVKMSYNNETDVYMFTLKSEDYKGYKAHERKELVKYYIPDGVYYIVNENGKTYVLSDRDGVKQVLDQVQDKNLYDTLMSYTMTEAINTGFLTSDKDANTGHSYSFDGGEYYYRNYQTGDAAMYATQYHLITYTGKPVQYEFADRLTSDQTFNFFIDFYYDDIAQDIPVISDWK